MKTDDILKEEIDLFRDESLRAIDRVKSKFSREKRARRRVVQYALGFIIFLIPASVMATSWLRFVPFRHGPQNAICGVGFSTGGKAFSPEPTKRWIDNLKVYELAGSEWVLRYSDDLEDDVIGGPPANWDVSIQCQAADLFIDSAGPDRNGRDFGKSIALIDTTTEDCGACVDYDFYDHDGNKVQFKSKLAIEWSVRHETPEESLIFEPNGTSKDHPFTVSMKGNVPKNPDQRGWIVFDTKDTVTGKDASYPVYQWQQDIWYKLRVEIDVPNQGYELFIDNKQMVWESY